MEDNTLFAAETLASKTTDRRIGLALSGGGFRATLYHAGALIRLNELGLLGRLDRITSVSGGSITSARLAARWSSLRFDEDGVASNLDEEVIQPLRRFCAKTLDLRVIFLGLVPFTRSISERLMDAYDDELLQGIRMDQLPEKPDFIFKATNLQTGRSFRFERTRLADYLVGEIRDTSRFRVATAVAASSAFPPVLSPVNIALKDGDWSDMPGTEFFGQRQFTRALNLTDGAVYDNLGLERINRMGTVLVSDAGGAFSYGPTFGMLSPKQVKRALDIAFDQSRARRMSTLFALRSFTDQNVAYWGIDMGETLDRVPDTLPHAPEITGRLASMRTRLNAFDPKEQGRLINWGYASADERLRAYIVRKAPGPTNYPVPEYPLA